MKLSIAEMRKKNEEVGSSWFKKSSFKYFGTVIEARPNIENLFITSEWTGFESRDKKYSLRQFNIETNEVETIGEFLQYDTLKEALEARATYTNQLFK